MEDKYLNLMEYGILSTLVVILVFIIHYMVGGNLGSLLENIFIL